MPPTTTTPSPLSSSAYDTEYRDKADDAWYTVRTILDGERLTIKFLNFNDDSNIVFEPNQFRSLKMLEEFADRFRPVSHQLQDWECRKVTTGTSVCAAHSSNSFDTRFYDAVIDDVVFKDHSFHNGEEECRCEFVIIWQHGPPEIVGCMTNKRIEHICILQNHAKPDSRVSLFIEAVRKKLGSTTNTPSLLGDADTRSQEISRTPTKPRSTFAQRFNQKAKCAKRSTVQLVQIEEGGSIGDHKQRMGEDTDMGGDSKCNVVLIENLDKELLPSTIVEFIRKQISVSVHAFIFPSLSWEAYTKGAIVLNCQENFEKVCDFLESPNHIVVSQRGRPVVVTRKWSGNDMITVPLLNFMLKDQVELLHKSGKICNNLKVISSSSEQYRKAKQLRDLFAEFIEHQQGLHKSLIMEENKILLPSQVV